MDLFGELVKDIFSSYQKTIGLFAIALLVISIPVTVNLIQTQHVSQTQAQEAEPYPATYPLSTDIKAHYCNSPLATLPEGFTHTRPTATGDICSCVRNSAVGVECRFIVSDRYYEKEWCKDADCDGSSIVEPGSIGVLFACRGWQSAPDSGYWVDLRNRVRFHIKESLPGIRNNFSNTGFRDADIRARKSIWNRMIAEIKFGDIEWPKSYSGVTYGLDAMSLEIFGRSYTDQINYENSRGCNTYSPNYISSNVCYRNDGGPCSETECHDHLPANITSKNPPLAYFCPQDIIQVPFLITPTPTPPNYPPEAVLSYCATPLAEIPPDFIRERSGDPPDGWDACSEVRGCDENGENCDGTATSRECGSYYEYQWCLADKGSGNAQGSKTGALFACRGWLDPISEAEKNGLFVDGRKRIQTLMDEEGDYYPSILNFFLQHGYKDAAYRAKKAIWNRFATEVKYGRIKWTDGQTAIDYTTDVVWGDGAGPEYWPYSKVLEYEASRGCPAPDPNFYTVWPNLCNRGAGPCGEDQCHDHLAANIDTKNPPFAYVCPWAIVGGDNCSGISCEGPFVCEVEGDPFSESVARGDITFSAGEEKCYDKTNWYLDGPYMGTEPLGPPIYLQGLEPESTHTLKGQVFTDDGSLPALECGVRSFTSFESGSPATPIPTPSVTPGTGGGGGGAGGSDGEGGGRCTISKPDPSLCSIDSYCAAPLAEIPPDFEHRRPDVPSGGDDCCDNVESAVCLYCSSYYQWRRCRDDSGVYGACLGTNDPTSSEVFVSLRNRVCVLMENDETKNSQCNGRGQGFYDGLREKFEERGYSDAADRAKKAVFNRIAAEIKFGNIDWPQNYDIDDISLFIFGRNYEDQQAFERSKGCVSPQNKDYYTVWPQLCIKDRGPCGELECLDHRLNPQEETPAYAYVCPSSVACTGGSGGTTSPSDPGATSTPAPTQTADPGGLAVEVSLQLTGVGSSEQSGNQLVYEPSVDATVQVYSNAVAVSFIQSAYAQSSASGTLVKEVKGKISFNGTIFRGRINLGRNIAEGKYYFVVKTPTTLSQRVPGEFDLKIGQTTALPRVEMTSGDLNDDNDLSVDDWNVFVSCYGEKQCTQKSTSDLNLDRKIDIIDGNILVRSYEKQDIRP